MGSKKLIKSSRLDQVLDEYAVEKVNDLSIDDVMNELEGQGIKSLEDLVSANLADFKGGDGSVANTFIYTQFVYKNKRVLDGSLMDVIESHIRGR